VTTGQQVASLSEAFSVDAIIVKTTPCFFSQEQAGGNKDGSGMDRGDLVEEGSGEGAGAGLSHGQLRSVARVRSFIGCTAIPVTSNLLNREPAKVLFLGYGMGWQSVETRVGNTACESSDWKSATSMQGFISGAMSGCAMLVLTAGIQTSSTSSGHSFDAAVLSSSQRQNAHGILSGSLTIIGFAYGFTDHTVKAGMTNTGFQSTRWQSSTAMQCRASRLSFQTSGVRVTVLESTVTFSESFTIDTCSINTTTSKNMPGGSTRIALVLTMQGTSFGFTPRSLHARTGRTGCEVTVWERDTSIVCLKWRVNGFVGTSPVIVTAGVLPASLSEAFSIDLGVISALRNSNLAVLATAIHDSYDTFGFFLPRVESASRDVTLAVRIGRTHCQGTEWTSQTSIICRIVLAQFASHHVSLTMGKGVSSVSAMHSFDVASFRVAGRSNRAAQSYVGWVLQYTLASLVSDLSEAVRIAGSAYSCSRWLSSTSLVCRSAVGAGQSHT